MLDVCAVSCHFTPLLREAFQHLGQEVDDPYPRVRPHRRAPMPSRLNFPNVDLLAPLTWSFALAMGHTRFKSNFAMANTRDGALVCSQSQPV